MELYKKQVALLLQVIPFVAKEGCFALHGGTGINLFVRNMPRLSVDIDLTYIPIEDRSISMEKINDALGRIKAALERQISPIKVNHQKAFLKLQISVSEAQIKLEVNQGMRGLIFPTENRVLCEAAQEQFDVFCTTPVVALGQLYGGKLVAALDRQHPRDLFDVQYLLEATNFTQEITTGFLYALVSSNRPVVEVLFPNFIDQSLTFTTQFEGMTNETFTYHDFEKTRKAMVKLLHNTITDTDKEFLLQFENGTPDWTFYNFKDYPSVQWKLQNILKLKQEHPVKHQSGLALLRDALFRAN